MMLRRFRRVIVRPSLLAEFGESGRWYNMAFISEPFLSVAPARNVIQLFGVVLGAIWLGACAQSPVVTQKAERIGNPRGALEHDQRPSPATHKRVAVRKQHTPFPSARKAAEKEVASDGLASFYTEGTKTASGEHFNTYQLTAAHPTLPFGTRLRVTSVATGRSVTVRVNDRGPYIPGRVVDLSYSAAESLGMVGDGVAKVKLDVVQ